MRSILPLFLASCLIACKNNDASTARQKDSTATAGTPVAAVPLATDSAARVEQLSFIDGCVESAKLTLGDAKAFAFCKCMYAQIQVRYPGLDSAEISRLDTAIVAKLAATCR